jgi:rSAM/selenodomain-associated transferase 2
MAENPKLSVVIPALNAALHLPCCLPALAVARESIASVTVVDGGSKDGTAEVAAKLGASVVTTAPGRGKQMIAGAGAARGDWLLFLHADTVLAAGWSHAALAFMSDPANVRRAAAFRFAFDDESAPARLWETLVAWRCRIFALPYGDQGLLISRRFYDALGGFKAIPLMEDVEIVRRIGRRRLVMLDAAAVTSAARYRSHGYLLRGLRNLSCLALFFLGLPPKVIARLYG